MSKIKVLVIPSDQHGVGKFRMLDPYKFIGDNYLDDFHIDLVFDVPNSDEVFQGYDVVIFHSFIHKTNHQDNIGRIKWLKSKGVKIIMDIDDLWFVDQRHPMYYHLHQSKIGEMKIEMMRNVDYITTTTPVFSNTIFKKLGLKNVMIFPNAVNEDESQFQNKKVESEKIRFGWLGGSSHLDDIQLLTDGISSIHYGYKDKVQFVLCGFDLRGTVSEIDKVTGKKIQRPIQPIETVWFKYENIFTDKYRVLDNEYVSFLSKFIKDPTYNDENKVYRRRWTENINQYATNYNLFDISLAPLVESDFNSNKSQLKIIEAGFFKKAIIASNTNPYLIDLVSAVDQGKFNDKGNALLVDVNRNHKDWAKNMKRLIESPNMIEDLGNRLYETVKDKYSLKKVCNDRVQFIKSII